MKIHPHPGTTLLELVCALGVIGILLGLTMPPLRSARDVFAVRAARDAIVGASARARAHAVHHGGADLRIDINARSLRIVTRDGVIDEATPITRSLDVRIQLDGTQATSATVPYDALAIGRLASRTISLRRGNVTGGVTFSSYGRPRIW